MTHADDARGQARAVQDFERQRKAQGLFAWLRQIGIMAYGPATPSPEDDDEGLDDSDGREHRSSGD